MGLVALLYPPYAEWTLEIHKLVPANPSQH